MAETTTATSKPASTSRLTCRATLRMRSTVATEVPPNFITRRGIQVSAGIVGRGRAGGRLRLSRYSASRTRGKRRRWCVPAPPSHWVGLWFGSETLLEHAAMPEWLEIPIGILGGLALVAGMLVLAITPELRARRRKRWLAAPSGAIDDAATSARILETYD